GRNQENQGAFGKRSCCYKFTLLYRHSKDGSEYKFFRQMCASKGPTVTVGKVMNTEEILGGYNPTPWKAYQYHPHRFYLFNIPAWVQTLESFIFSLNKDSLDKNIVSFVVDSEHAICEGPYQYP